ncbi:jg20127 [Pararge aegeria aegeria]|uniref:Jg20127 protein n=1 Tax=Pararge aegeria aegeria TaxID=348720 RepID=A0A8S4R8H3_9NEOP|nr:jg20127 [Pararge aegeria aegeria]
MDFRKVTPASIQYEWNCLSAAEKIHQICANCYCLILTYRLIVHRQVLDNGTLSFLPFAAPQYRQDVHATVYRCRAHNAHGAIVSRDMRTQAG